MEEHIRNSTWPLSALSPALIFRISSELSLGPQSFAALHLPLYPLKWHNTRTPTSRPHWQRVKS